jgi:biofilm PGA synthesis N-glycosyltransferase PgaC
MQVGSYVLISACHNEEAYVRGLIDTIARQTVSPLRWIIVDDGSTDATYSNAVARSKELPFLQIVRMPSGRTRSFTSQVFAAQYGYTLIKEMEFDFVAFLDADIRLEPDYYERLITLLNGDKQLGLGGGVVIDKYEDRTENSRGGSEEFHVAGGVQLFRRRCFEQIGGYCAIDGGGQDTIADVMSVMHGWKVRAFSQIKALHLRPEGFVKEKVFGHGMKWGRKFYLLGYHPLFYFGQCIRRSIRRPFVIGSVFQLFGFVWATIKGEPRPVSPEFVRFLRRAQMRRVREAIVSIRPRRARPNRS